MDKQNPYAAPQIIDITAPGAAWAADESPGLRKTSLGLTLVYYGIIGVLVFSLGTAVAVSLMPGFVLLCSIGAGFGVLLTVVGPLFCLAVPRQTGARRFIVASVVCQLPSVAHSMVSAVTDVPLALTYATLLAGLVATVLFVLFMKKLAEYIGRRDLAKKAKNILILGGVLVVLVVLLNFLTSEVNESTQAGVLPGWFGPGFMIVIAIVAITALLSFVMYANLVNWLRKALHP